MQVQALNDMAAFTEYYADANNADKLWTTGATGGKLSKLTLPRMLALPTCVAEFINSREGVPTPHGTQIHQR